MNATDSAGIWTQIADSNFSPDSGCATHVSIFCCYFIWRNNKRGFFILFYFFISITFPLQISLDYFAFDNGSWCTWIMKVGHYLLTTNYCLLISNFVNSYPRKGVWFWVLSSIVDLFSCERLSVFPLLDGVLIALPVIRLIHVCLNTSRPQVYMSRAVMNLHLIDMMLLSRSKFWCTRLLWRSSVTLSTKSVMAPLVSPVHIGGHHISTPPRTSVIYWHQIRFRQFSMSGCESQTKKIGLFPKPNQITIGIFFVCGGDPLFSFLLLQSGTFRKYQVDINRGPLWYIPVE